MAKKEHPPITWPLAGLLLLSVLAIGGCKQFAEAHETAELLEKQWDEIVAMRPMTWEEIEPLLDSSWTLERILEDPLGARCRWVWITGEVLPTNKTGYPYSFGDEFYLGRVDVAAGVYKVIEVRGGDTVPKAGATVSVVGKFLCTQVRLEKGGNDIERFESRGNEYRLYVWGMEEV